MSKRLIIAAAASHSGKTLITCALLRIMQRKGLAVSSFKCGPDYIDPMFHRKVLHVPSRNLDLYLAGQNGVIGSLSVHQKDISIIEGVMGYFDGRPASSYDMACLTQTPVLFIADVYGMAESMIPLLQGFIDYQRKPWIQGIFLNRISDSYYESIKDQLSQSVSIPIVGHLPNFKKQFLKERHLGLVQPDEMGSLQMALDQCAKEVEKRLDWEALWQCADAKTLRTVPQPIHIEKKQKIGIAYDEAFSFYYPENMEMLENRGMCIQLFSLLHDKKLPDVDGLIIGGGYPELYAKALSENQSMIQSVRQAAENKIPILAECGGFMYLQESIDGFPMAGVLKGHVKMTNHLVDFGYVEISSLKDNGFLKKGESIRGHEFHYSTSDENGKACVCRYWKKAKQKEAMVIQDNIFAGYPHLYYPSCPALIDRYVKKVKESSC